MIEEAHLSEVQDCLAIKLEASEAGDLSDRMKDVPSPSPPTSKDAKAGRNSESTSRQGLDSKAKIEAEVLLDDVGYVFDEDTVKKFNKKTTQIRPKRIKKRQRNENKGDFVRKDAQRVDTGTQTKSKNSNNQRVQNLEIVPFPSLEPEDQLYSSSDSKPRPHRYSIRSSSQKLQIIELANQKGNHYAAKIFGVSVNNINRWKLCCYRRPGAGRKVSDPNMETALIDWIEAYKQKYQAIPQRRDVRAKAMQLSKTKGFQASKGWYERFMDRNDKFRSLPKMRAEEYEIKMEVKLENPFSDESSPEHEDQSKSQHSKEQRSVVYMQEEDGEAPKEFEVKMEVEQPLNEARFLFDCSDSVTLKRLPVDVKVKSEQR